MPTIRPRHMIIETPPVQEALDELRGRLAEGARIDLAELVMLGAEVKARQLAADDATAAACSELADQIRSGSLRHGGDVGAADEVKRLGLTADHDS